MSGFLTGGLVARHTITRLRPARVDDGHGNLRSDWSAASSLSLVGFAVDVGASSEDLEHRDGDQAQLTLRGPVVADVEAGDRVVLSGVTYLVVGAVLRQPGPSPLTSHCIVQLSRWEG